MLLANVNSAASDGSPRLSWDELTLYFLSNRSDTAASGSGFQIMVAQRNQIGEDFAVARDVGGTINEAPGYDTDPMLSRDGTTLLFVRGSSQRSAEVMLATRSAPAAAFGAASVVANVNSDDWDDGPFLRSDGTELVFRSLRTGGAGAGDLYRATGSVASGFSAATPISELNTSVNESGPVLSADGLTIYWTSSRPDGGALGEFDIWTAARPTLQAPFAHPVDVIELGSSASDGPGWLSPDGCRMYLASSRSGNWDLYVSERPD